MTPLDVGDEIAGVRLDEVVARRGASAVFRGVEVATGTTKAVKAQFGDDDAAAGRLRSEASLLSQIDHPQIVRLHTLHEEAGVVALITEWAPGESLLSLIRSGEQFSAERVASILAALADPLDYLHGHRLVHRDISPSNIIVTSDGHVTLVDLGIGHEVGTSTLTNHDLLAGTPVYLAPEIIRGEPAGPASDQYSLAVVVHQLAAGGSPFPASDELATALHHQLHTAPEPLREMDPSVPAALSAAVERALDKDPKARFASVGEFAAAATQEGEIAPEASPRSGRSNFVVMAGALLVAGLALIAWPFAETASDDLVPIADEVAGLVALSSGSQETEQQAPETEEPDATQQAPGDAAAAEAVAGADASWPDRAAESLACNLLQGSGFESGSVPLDYFGDPPGRERVVDQGGHNNSWALEIGQANNFGQYGEVVPVTPGESYLFRGWFRQSGTVEAGELGISLLDASFQGLDISVSATIVGGDPGFRQVQLDDVPTQAAYAVPYLFKDSSPGVVLADELIFGPAGSCLPEIGAAQESE